MRKLTENNFKNEDKTIIKITDIIEAKSKKNKKQKN